MKGPQELPAVLGGLVAGDQVSRRILECAWPPHRNETVVDELHKQCVDQGFSNVLRTDVVKVLKNLQDHELGRFFAGRKGKPSRFVWNRANELSSGKSTSLGSQGKGEGRSSNVALESIEEKRDEEDTGEVIEHGFAVRPTFKTSIVLPVDFSTQEADRLAEFIRMLPFAGQGRG